MRGVKLTLRRGERLEVCSAAVVTLGNFRRRGKLGCWLMADRVARDARAQLTLLGRRGATVKLAGRRVNLGEVAARLRRLAGVRDVWIGVSAGNEPVLGAAVVTERPVAELRAELLADTATWKVPKKFVAVAALPVTERGKIDAAALRRMAFGG
jgi:acyl-coenzyme A synthetase/AMP-(fatty) acid ligase